MPSPSSLTGGARIGVVNYSWPFAKLSASPEGIRLRVTFNREYVFPVDSVLTVVAHGLIPLLGTGIRIEHTVDAYPARVIFWYPMKPQRELFGFLRAAGFPAEKLEQ